MARCSVFFGGITERYNQQKRSNTPGIKIYWKSSSSTPFDESLDDKDVLAFLVMCAFKCKRCRAAESEVITWRNRNWVRMLSLLRCYK